jgi:hypothetical protein
MGTLFNQVRRDDYKVYPKDVENFIADYLEPAGIAPPTTLAEYQMVMQMLEARRQGNILVNDNDVRDEQLAGFGELLQTLNSHIETFLSGHN